MFGPIGRKLTHLFALALMAAILLQPVGPSPQPGILGDCSTASGQTCPD